MIPRRRIFEPAILLRLLHIGDRRRRKTYLREMVLKRDKAILHVNDVIRDLTGTAHKEGWGKPQMEFEDVPTSEPQAEPDPATKVESEEG